MDELFCFIYSDLLVKNLPAETAAKTRFPSGMPVLAPLATLPARAAETSQVTWLYRSSLGVNQAAPLPSTTAVAPRGAGSLTKPTTQ